MNANYYQHHIAKFVKSNPDAQILHFFAGVAEESGEVAGVLSKTIRGDYGPVNLGDYRTWPQEVVDKLEKEVGDLMFYTFSLLRAFDIPAERVLINNYNKLSGREERGTIHGSGDTR